MKHSHKQVHKHAKSTAFALILGCHLCAGACLADTALNPKVVLEFPIAKGGLTRISIENDGIEDIYVYPTEYADNISHHKSGHVFVVTDDLEKPFYVTLVTKRGIAQDLKLIPRIKKAEPILLRLEEDLAGVHLESNGSPLSLQDVLAKILGEFASGSVPAGFVPTETFEVARGTGTTEAVLEQAYQNGTYRVLAFVIKNEGADKITLDHKVFWGKGDLASVIDEPVLGPQQSAKVYVIQHY
jgi:hypothetical protein